MRAGELDRQVELQVATTTPDSFGEPDTTWATLATVWAQVTQLRGRELFQAQQLQAEVDTRFRIRYREDLGVTARIKYEERFYDIHVVSEIGRREGLEILATAVAS